MRLLSCVSQNWCRGRKPSHIHCSAGSLSSGFSLSFIWSLSHTHRKDRGFSFSLATQWWGCWALSEAFATDYILQFCFNLDSLIHPLTGTRKVFSPSRQYDWVCGTARCEPEVKLVLHSLHLQGLSWVWTPSSALAETFPTFLNMVSFTLVCLLMSHPGRALPKLYPFILPCVVYEDSRDGAFTKNLTLGLLFQVSLWASPHCLLSCPSSHSLAHHQGQPTVWFSW